MAKQSQKAHLDKLNQALISQNQILKNARKVAQNTVNTQNLIQGELNNQKQIIQSDIDKNKRIKRELRSANRKANQMKNRNTCVKCMLWLAIFFLFAGNVGLIIWKVM